MSAGAERPPEFSQLLREIDSVVSTSEQRHKVELLALRQQVSDSSVQISNLERQVQTQTQRNGTLQSEISQLQRQLRQYSGVSEQLEELRVQSEQLRQHHDQAKVKHKRHMQRSKDRQAQLEAENASRLSELETSRLNHQAARAQLATAASDERSAKEELASVRQRNSSLSEKCGLLRQQLEQCEADRSVLQSQMHDSCQQYQKHIAELESKIHTLRMTSTSNLELTKSSLDKAQAQVHQLTEENLNLRRQLTKANADLELTNVNYACLKDELAGIKEDLQLAQNTEKRDAGRLAELEHKLQQKEDVIRAFEESHERASAVDIARLRHEVEGLTQQLQQCSMSEADLQTKVARVTARAGSCQHENDSLRKELLAALAEADRHQEACKQLQSKESSAREERSDAQRSRLEVLQLQSCLSAREEEARRWSEQLLTAKEQLRNATDARDACHAQLKVANQQLDELRHQNASLRTGSPLNATPPRSCDKGKGSVASATATATAGQRHTVQRLTSAKADQHSHTSSSSIGTISSEGMGGLSVRGSNVASGPFSVSSQASSASQPKAAQYSQSALTRNGGHQSGSASTPKESFSLTASQSSLSKFSRMDSVSSLTTSDSDLSVEQDLGRGQARAPCSEAARLLVPGNRRLSGDQVAVSGPSMSVESTPRDTSTLTPSRISTFVSDFDDSSQALSTAAEQAGDSSTRMMSEDFVQGFLSDHMNLLQARIEETMQKLGLEKGDT